MRVLALVLSLGLAASAEAAEPPLPAGWRHLTAAEAASAQLSAERELGKAFKRGKYNVAADFDGDGRRDTAVMLVDQSGKRFGLFVHRAATDRYEPLDAGGEAAYLWNYGIFLERPQPLVDVCHAGIGDDKAPCPPKTRNRWPALGFAKFEAAYQVFYWTGSRFDRVWLAD